MEQLYFAAFDWYYIPIRTGRESKAPREIFLPSGCTALQGRLCPRDLWLDTLETGKKWMLEPYV